MTSEKALLLQHIADVIVNLDTQIHELKEVFRHAEMSRTGKAFVIVGPSLSGKTLLINHVVKKNECKITGDAKRTIDGNFVDDSDGTEILDQLNFENKSLLIVDNFEQFARRSRQQLLYDIMNKSCSSECLVILTSTDFNCTDRFEKRVRSRMAQKKISIPFDNDISPIDAFFQLLVPKEWRLGLEKTDLTRRWIAKCEGLKESKHVVRDITRILTKPFNIGIYRIKQLAMCLAIKYFDCDDEQFAGFDQDLTPMGDIVVFSPNHVKAYITNFHIQQLFILELMRRVSLRTGDRFIHQINIFRTFSRLIIKLRKKTKPSKRNVYCLLTKLRENGVVGVKEGCHNAQPDYIQLALKVSSEMIAQVWNQVSRKSFLADVFVNAMV